MESLQQSTTPYWRLSGFYFFYFCTLGALIPYWGLYLKSLGFGAVEIGELIAILSATKLVSPNIWGWIADHTGRSITVVRITSLLAALSFALVLVESSYLWLALVMVLFSFFWNAALPQFEAVTFNHLGERSHAYGQIRLWGSIGFIVVVVALGPLLDRFGASILPLVLLPMFILIWGMSLLVAESSRPSHGQTHASIWKVLRQPAVVALLIACLLLQASHGPYYSFYSIYLEESGYSKGLTGLLWGLGVAAEVVLFLLVPRWLPRFNLGRLLALSLLLTALRWLMIAFFVESLLLLLLAQLLHAASFGLYHAVAISLIHRFFTGRHQGRGQALYASVSFGGGGALGSFMAGHFWDSLGATPTFLFAALVALIAAGVAMLVAAAEGKGLYSGIP